jgi:hypothetical protein
MPSGQNRLILTSVTLSGSDVTNAAMAVIMVVPVHKIGQRMAIFEADGNPPSG